jgi:hypothetical protein
VNKEANLILIIIIMFIVILVLLYVVAKLCKTNGRMAQRMEGLDDLLLNRFLINERDNEKGRTGESS